MQFSFERELDLMTKYNITAEELYVVLLIFYAQEGHGEFISRYYSQVQPTTPLRDVLVSLQSKGLINKTYKIPETGMPFVADDVEFNQNVMKQFMQHSYDMGFELFMAYPPTLFINGREYSLRNIAKNFKSMDEFCYTYGKSIKFNPEKHKEVMELLEWAKDENLINSGICDFVISMKWLELEQLRNEDDRDLNDTSRLL